jgi:hypothetical protein
LAGGHGKQLDWKSVALKHMQKQEEGHHEKVFA